MLLDFKKFVQLKSKSTDEPFQKTVKNYDSSNLPPWQVELHKHSKRSHYITNIWRNTNQQFPANSIPDKNCWKLNEEQYTSDESSDDEEEYSDNEN